MSGFLHGALIAAIASGVWLFRAYFMPNARCRRCGGTKVNVVTRWWGGGERSGPCGKCGGSGSRMVLGSRTVHKAVRGLRSARSNKKG